MSQSAPLEQRQTVTPPAGTAEWRSGDLRLLQLASFLSTYDRFGIAPMLLAIAASFHVGLNQVATVATAYYLLYGLSQPIWGMLSDYVGRVRLMRAALAGAALGGLLSALSPSLEVLVVARAITGGLFAAVIPSSLVYIADAVPIGRRHAVLTKLLSATATGTACGFALSGVGASYVSWRLVFAATAVAAAVMSILLRTLPEVRPPRRQRAALRSLLGLFRNQAVVAVCLAAMAEGGLIFGLMTFLAPAIELTGQTAAVAGLTIGIYGFAVLGWAIAVRRCARVVHAGVLVAGGGLLVAAAYGVAALSENLLGGALSVFLLGGGFAFIHPTLQTWATEVVPGQRAGVISLFAASLYVGSAIATSAAAGLAAAGLFTHLFAIGSLLAIPLGLAGGLARRRFAYESR
jgi:predicted MFS family arabinose efflux permease